MNYQKFGPFQGQNGSSATFAENLTDLVNATEFELYEISVLFSVVLVSLHFLTSVVAIVGNIAILWIILTIAKMNTVPNLLIANLSASDIIVTITCTPFTVASNVWFLYWPFGRVLCPVVNYIQLTTVLQRAFSLIVLTANTYKVTFSSFLRTQQMSYLKVKILIVLSWIIPLSLSLPAGLFSEIQHLPYNPGYKGVCVESWTNGFNKFVFSITVMVLHYVLPLVMMVILYSRIAVMIWTTKTPGEDNTQNRKSKHSKYKTLKMFVIIVTLYGISWLPFHTVSLIGDWNPNIYDLKSVHVMWLFFHWLSNINAGINPIIYGWRNSAFRQGFKRFFNKLVFHEFFKMDSGSTYTSIASSQRDLVQMTRIEKKGSFGLVKKELHFHVKRKSV